ncbi:MAG: hypothetical protein ACK55I_49675, partial [bacterium]
MLHGERPEAVAERVRQRRELVALVRLSLPGGVQRLRGRTRQHRRLLLVHSREVRDRVADDRARCEEQRVTASLTETRQPARLARPHVRARRPCRRHQHQVALVVPADELTA